MRRYSSPVMCALLGLLCLVGFHVRTFAQSQISTPRNQRRIVTLADEVRHQLVTLPYYSVFDWLEGNVTANGEVTLAGYVVKPTTKTDAEARVKHLESVSRVVNKIEVLPLSPNDDQLRIALYRSIFKFDSPLFRY